jgi:hypothetical protein
MMTVKAKDVVIELPGAFGEEGREVWARVDDSSEGKDVVPKLFAGSDGFAAERCE